MSEPIVFISHFQVKEGKLDAFKQHSQEVAKLLQADKPRTLVFLTYVSDNGTQMTAVHVFADAETMGLHFQGSEGRGQAAYEFLVPDGWEIYGTPSDAVVEQMRAAALASGVTLTVQSEYVAGFLRPTSG